MKKLCGEGGRRVWNAEERKQVFPNSSACSELEPEQQCVGGLSASDRGCTSHPREGDRECRGCLGFTGREVV